MDYKNIQSRLEAFKYKDPLAADKFYVCNKITKICCRPNCDMNNDFNENEKHRRYSSNNDFDNHNDNCNYDFKYPSDIFLSNQIV